MTGPLPDERSLLVISHPGHELRLYGWIDRVQQPWVCILTDGSGGDGAPRLDKTLHVLHALRAETGPICGELSDRRIYEEMLHHKYHLFDILCERLARLIIVRDIDIVVSDAMEGYNPTHDLCEVLAQAAVAIANSKRNRTTRHYTFPLMGDPRQPPADGQYIQTAACATTCHTIELTPSQFKRKLEVIRNYADSTGGKLQEGSSPGPPFLRRERLSPSDCGFYQRPTFGRTCKGTSYSRSHNAALAGGAGRTYAGADLQLAPLAHDCFALPIKACHMESPIGRNKEILDTLEAPDRRNRPNTADTTCRL